MAPCTEQPFKNRKVEGLYFNTTNIELRLPPNTGVPGVTWYLWANYSIGFSQKTHLDYDFFQLKINFSLELFMVVSPLTMDKSMAQN
jgi:hypothetical protein